MALPAIDIAVVAVSYTLRCFLGAYYFFWWRTGTARDRGVRCGHLWPLQLGFRGGKGIAASLGVALVYARLTLTVAVGVFLVLRTALKNFTLAWLTSFVLAPGIEWATGYDMVKVLGLILLVALVLPRHCADIVDEISSRSPG